MAKNVNIYFYGWIKYRLDDTFYLEPVEINITQTLKELYIFLTNTSFSGLTFLQIAFDDDVAILNDQYDLKIYPFFNFY